MRFTSLITLALLCFCFFQQSSAVNYNTGDKAILNAFYNTLSSPAKSALKWTTTTGTVNCNSLSYTGATCDASGRVSSLNIPTKSLNIAIPIGLKGLTALSYLNLGSNGLTGTIPTEYATLTQLTFLDLSSNTLSNTIPKELSSLTKLTFLDLSSNSLSGSIPSELASLTALQFLYLSSNTLSTIPSELATISSLKILDLGLNSLKGTIPTSFGSFAALRELYLNGNQFTSIPAELTGLAGSLQLLELSSNAMSGTVPTFLTKLSALTSLSLSANLFTGSLPEFLGSLTNLLSLDVMDNHFYGGLSSTSALNSHQYTFLFLQGTNAICPVADYSTWVTGSSDYTGPSCNPCPSDWTLCQNSATCSADLSGHFQCNCQPFTSGTFCETIITGCDAQPSYGHASWPNGTFNSYATGTCNPGYRAIITSSPTKRKCLSSGFWDHRIINGCARIYCSATTGASGTQWKKTAAGTTAVGVCPATGRRDYRPCDLDGNWGAEVNCS